MLRSAGLVTGEKRGTSVDIDIDAIGHDLLFGTAIFRSDEPGSAGSSSTTESWATAETGDGGWDAPGVEREDSSASDQTTVPTAGIGSPIDTITGVLVRPRWRG